MFKKISKFTHFGRQEKLVERYMKEVNDIQSADLTRRELFKMGLTAGVGGLTAVGGGAFLPNLAEAASFSTGIISPLCRNPWTDPLPIPKTAVSVGNFSGPTPDKGQCLEPQTLYNPGKGALGGNEIFTEARTEEHQRWDELGGLAACTKYELMAKEIDWNFYSDSARDNYLSKVWTYVDMNPNPNNNNEFAAGVLRLKAQYGKPVLMRMYNGLPKEGRDTQGFGISQCSTHLHNAHNPPVSDGGPMRFYDSGKWFDYWYPNIRAGFASTHKSSTRIDANNKSWSCPGDWKETQSTLWFHDHRMDFTAANTYKGMVSFYTLFSKDINLDTDDEKTGLKLPSGNYDIPLLFADKVFDQNGQLFFDSFNIEGIIGDQQTVNFKIKPFLTVERRKYRFRFLDGGPSRFIELSVTSPDTKIVAPVMTRIANCGNLLPKAQIVTSIRLGVAERADVIIDFGAKDSKGNYLYPNNTVFYLENRLEQLNGKGPTGRILASSDKTKLLQFKVSDVTTVDNSAPLTTLQTQVMVPFPDRTKNPIKIKRKFDFGTSNGAWVVNGKFFSPNLISAYPIEGSQEEWTLTSPGGWAHPVHIHHEEFQITKRNGVTPTALDDLSRKDVVRIGDAAQGTAGTSSITFNIQFRDWVGDYPMHCHNVVHEDHAMMIRFKIVPSNDPNAGK